MIRKISIGIDYKDAMHYTVGQRFGHMTIEAIRRINPNHHEIWIRTDEDEVLLWKEIIDMPCICERDTKAFG